MPRYAGGSRNRAAAKTTRSSRKTGSIAGAPSASAGSVDGNDDFLELRDLCAAAQQIAETNGEKLLAFLLAMAIQESQIAMRRRSAMRAAEKPAAKPSV